MRIAVVTDSVKLLVTEFAPAMGAHTRPGVLGLAFFGEWAD